MTSNAAAETQDRRPWGLWQSTALVVGTIVGSAIMTLPTLLAQFGADALPGSVVTLFGTLLLALTFSDLARRYPISRQPFGYVRIAFGRFAAFFVTFLYWTNALVGSALVAVSFADSVAWWLPGLIVTPMHAAICALLALWSCAALCLGGARAVGPAQLVLTTLKVLPLVAFVLAGLAALGASSSANVALSSTPFSFPAVIGSASVVLWALAGFEVATMTSGYMRSRAEIAPRATMLGFSIGAGLTFIATFLVFRVLPLEQLKLSGTPFAEAARTYLGDKGALATAVGMSLSCLGATCAWVFVQSHMLTALFRTGIEQRARRSRVAVLFGCAMASLLIGANFWSPLTDVFSSFVNIASAGIVLPFLAASAAALHLGSRQGRKAAWRQIAAGLALLYSAVVFVYAGATMWAWSLAFLVFCVPVYHVKRAARSM